MADRPPGHRREMSITVEDIDPFRDCQAWAAAGRLTAAGLESVAAGPAGRCPAARGRSPAYASVIGTGLRSVVPMRPAGSEAIAAAGRRGRRFGALALALPGQRRHAG